MISTTETQLPRVDAAKLALAAVAPIAIGGVLAVRAGDLSPMVLTPAIVFGVAAATCPALYIAIAATKEQVSMLAMIRGLGIAVGAFGIALAGLVLPALFLSLSSVSEITTLVVCSCTLAAAGLLAMFRLGKELAPQTVMGCLVCATWALATLGIASRLWFDLATQVLL